MVIFKSAKLCFEILYDLLRHRSMTLVSAGVTIIFSYQMYKGNTYLLHFTNTSILIKKNLIFH